MKPTVAELRRQRWIEREKVRLNAAVSLFASAMRQNLWKQADTGKRGWDDPHREWDWSDAMARETLKCVRGKDRELQAACYAMFVWRLKRKKAKR
jgi:hypothetical protein